MAKNRIICQCNEVSYIDIRKAMISGARTIEEIGEITGAGAKDDCGRCKPLIQNIIDTGK